MHCSVLFSKYVLLAEDDEDDCLFFEDALKEVASASQLKMANNGEELMELLSASGWPAPDLIFLDLNMPKKSGLECLREIRRTERFKNIPVVIFSNSSHAKNLQTTYELGANIFVQKPGTFQHLMIAIRNVLAMDFGANFFKRSFSNYFYAW